MHPRLLGKAFGSVVMRPREAWQVVRLAAWVAVLSALVKFMPLPKVLSRVSASPRRGDTGAERFTAERIAQLLDAVLASDALCFTPTFWKHAAILHRYLALSGRETCIVFGVRKATGSAMLSGPGWVEEGGRSPFEARVLDFKVTFRHPEPQTFRST